MSGITIGKHSRLLRDVRQSIRHGALTPGGLLPIEGPKLLDEAVRSGLDVTDVFVTRTGGVPGFEGSAAQHVVAKEIFKTIQSTETTQGVLALVRPPAFTLADLLAAQMPLILVLDRVQDPGNTGTILRIAEAFMASGCIALKGTAGLYNPKTVRASAGSLFRLPAIQGATTQSLVDVKRKGLRLIAATRQAEETIDRWNWIQPSAVVIGNEGGGLDPDIVRLCDTVLRVPQNPAVDSLNAAVAAAVILYEAWKQRMRPARES